MADRVVILLFFWSLLACTDRATTVSVIVYVEWSLPVPLKNYAHITSGNLAIRFQRNLKNVKTSGLKVVG